MLVVRFLTVEQILTLHEARIALYGGDVGVRDMGLVESAAAMPRQAFDGELLHPTLPAMAAAYFYHLVANHGFVDGNKRVGVAAALVFLRLNGHYLDASDDELEQLTLGVAGGSVDKKTATAFFTSRTHAAT